MTKIFYIVCTLAIFAKSSLGQCIGYAAPRPCSASSWGPVLPQASGCGVASGGNWGTAVPIARGSGAALGSAWGAALPVASGCGSPVALEIAPTSGGGLPVTSSSLIAPTGIVITSENAIEGAVELIGELPFIGSVGFDKILGSSGTGAVSHSCGNGITAVESIAPISGVASWAPSVGLNGALPAAGSVGLGCGCGGNWAY